MFLLRGEGVGFGDLEQADDAGAVVVGAVEDLVAVGAVVVVVARDDDPLVLELRVAPLECGQYVAVGDDVPVDAGRDLADTEGYLVGKGRPRGGFSDSAPAPRASPCALQ